MNFLKLLIAIQIISGAITSIPAQDKLETICNKLASTPVWGRINSTQESKERAARLVEVLISIKNNLSTDEARQVVSTYSNRFTSDPEKALAETSKLFIFNRIYFAVPQWDVKEAARYRGGWLPSEAKDGKVNMLLPLKIDSNGAIELAYSGFSYLGSDYDAVAEFDLFRTRYPIRK